MRDHTKLRAFALVDEMAMIIYQGTRDFPKKETEKVLDALIRSLRNT
jgi:hypothetical protein